MDFRLSTPRKKTILERLIQTQNCELMEDIGEDILKKVIKPGTLAVDGGVNQGRHTRHMVQSVGSRGKLVSVEPLPAFSNYLQLVYGIYPQFQFVNSALYDKPHLEMDFTVVRDRNTVSSLKLAKEYEGKYSVEVIKVKTATIDCLLSDSPLPCSAIKLDLEGAEYPAITGAAETIKRHRPVIFFEDGKETTARNFGFNLREYYNLWSDYDYALISVFGENYRNYEEYVDYNPWYTFAVPKEKMDLQNYIVERFNARISQYI